MDAYQTAHLKYVMDLEWDILQALRTLMKRLKVPGDAPVGETSMQLNNEPAEALIREIINTPSLDPWANADEGSDT